MMLTNSAWINLEEFFKDYKIKLAYEIHMLLFADKIDVLLDEFLELGCKYLPLNICLQKGHLLKF